MPWLSSDARKAVLTEWFWQPIRGQPRRVDTNELRKYSSTVWVQSITQAILNQITYNPYVIMPKKKVDGEEVESEGVKKEIELVEYFLKNPNKNNESLADILRALLKDVLEIDAGVIVKVYSIDSFDFEHLEPRSGAPLLKPIFCPTCNGQGQGEEKAFKEKADRILTAIMKSEKNLNKLEKQLKEKEQVLIRPDYSRVREKMVEVISGNSPNDENTFDQDRVARQPGVVCPFCKGNGRGRVLTEIYARDGSSFLCDIDRTGWTYGYWQYSYSIPAHPMWFSRDEVVYMKMNNRSMSPYGYSAVQSSLDVIKSLESSVQHNKTLFVDGAVPDGIVGVEDMSNEEMSRMKTTWENEVKGQPHKVVFVNKRAQFSTFAFNNREMQFLEGQKEAWNQVIANFNMTPADLGITRDLNRSSATAMGEQTKKRCIKPLMLKIENIMNQQILPELGVQNVEFNFVVSDPVEERQNAEIAEIKLRNNLTTPNEIREEWGMEPIEGGDETNASRQAQQMQDAAAMNPMNDKKPSHHKPGEIREQRDSTNEGAKRDRESETKKPNASVNKDYQSAFQAQVPFLTTIQNLSTPVPFALPKTGHPNTMAPYKELSGLCPGCGSEQFAESPAVAGSVNSVRMWRCQACGRNFGEQDLAGAIKTQEVMHERSERDPLAPRVNQQELGMTPVAPTPNLVATPESQEQVGQIPQMLNGNSLDTTPTKPDPFGRGPKPINSRKKKVKP